MKRLRIGPVGTAAVPATKLPSPNLFSPSHDPSSSSRSPPSVDSCCTPAPLFRIAQERVCALLQLSEQRLLLGSNFAVLVAACSRWMLAGPSKPRRCCNNFLAPCNSVPTHLHHHCGRTPPTPPATATAAAAAAAAP